MRLLLNCLIYRLHGQENTHDQVANVHEQFGKESEWYLRKSLTRKDGLNQTNKATIV